MSLIGDTKIKNMRNISQTAYVHARAHSPVSYHDDDVGTVVTFNTNYPMYVPGPTVHLLHEYVAHPHDHRGPNSTNLHELKWTLARHATDVCTSICFEDLAYGIMPCRDVATRAIIRIQSIFRMVLARRRIRSRVMNKRKWEAIPVLARFFKKGLKKNVKIAQLQAVRKIQAFFRGTFTRYQFCRRIHAVIVIGYAWRQYKMRLLCQRSLRRLDRPLIISIDEIINFPVQHVHSGKLTVRISLYSFSLLHIVTGSDIAASIVARKPNLTWTLEPVRIKARVNGELVSSDSFVGAAGASHERACHGHANGAAEVSSDQDESESSSSSSGDDEDVPKSAPRLLSKKVSEAVGGSFSRSFNTLSRSVRSLVADKMDRSVTETDKEKSNSHSCKNKPSSISPNGSFREMVGGDCVFNYQVILPGCHGNSVLRFDVMDEGRKLANFTYLLRRGSGMLFWGGPEVSPLAMKTLQRSSVRARQRQSVTTDTVSLAGTGLKRDLSVLARDKLNPRLRGVEAAYASLNPENAAGVIGVGPQLKHSVVSGLRSDWCNFYISGNGPACRRYWAKKGIFAFMMYTWHSTFVCLTREKICFFYKRMSLDPFLSIPLANIVSIDVVQGSRQVQGDINPKAINKGAFADTHNLELRTKFGDTVHLRMLNLKIRNMWLFYLYKAHAAEVMKDNDRRLNRPLRVAIMQRISQFVLPDYIIQRALASSAVPRIAPLYLKGQEVLENGEIVTVCSPSDLATNLLTSTKIQSNSRRAPPASAPLSPIKQCQQQHMSIGNSGNGHNNSGTTIANSHVEGKCSGSNSRESSETANDDGLTEVQYEVVIARGLSDPNMGMGVKLEIVNSDSLTPRQRSDSIITRSTRPESGSMKSRSSSNTERVCIAEFVREADTHEYLPLERTGLVLPGDLLLRVDGHKIRHDDIELVQNQIDDAMRNSSPQTPVKLELSRRVRRGVTLPGQIYNTPSRSQEHMLLSQPQSPSHTSDVGATATLAIDSDLVQPFDMNDHPDNNKKNDDDSGSSDDDAFVTPFRVKNAAENRREVNAIAYAAVKLKKIKSARGASKNSKGGGREVGIARHSR